MLDVIDEASGNGDLHRSFDEAKRTWLRQRAQLRELDGRLEGRSELTHKLSDLKRKLAALEQSHHAEEREAVLNEVKQRPTGPDEKFGGHFSNYLQRKLERPEFADYIQCWFPDDDLRIQYSRTGDGRDWQAITQGSQGQRAAALLAFLLAFGDEPLILDQPEDDLDNHLIYDLIVRQIRENKRRRQLIIVTHNPNVVVNGDAEMVYAFDFHEGQCRVMEKGALQEQALQEEVCQVMEGGREAFSRRWKRLGRRV